MNSINKYPLKISYITKSAIWGGTKLKTDWGKISDLDCVAESWELSVREKEMATVINGEYSGMTLGEYIKVCGNDSVSDVYDGGRFPLLIKYIDACDKLSVQVHPDDVYAGKVENDSGKTEMWYIVDADDDAEIIYGIKEDVSEEEFAKAVRAGNIDSVLEHHPVKAGETYFIPSGMLHAIGAGIVIAEIQQNSDLTYRVYDYERRQKDGSLRELHVDKSIDVTRKFTEEEINAIRYARGFDGNNDILANSEFFKVTMRNINGNDLICADSGSFVSLLCLEGEGKLIFEDKEYPIAKGDSYYIPAGTGDVKIVGKMRVIDSRVK